MPVYVYKCNHCNEEIEEIRIMDFRNHIHPCKKCKTGSTYRNMAGEGYAVIEDWPPGHNESIDYDYKNKADLLSEMRRRGLRPLKHGGGITRARPGLYGKEEHRGIMEKSERALATLQET